MQNTHQTRSSLILRGGVALIFGLFALSYPHFTLSFFVIIFGIYVFASGLMTLLLALFSREYDTNWWVYFFEGLFSMIAGIIVFCWPDMTAVIFLYILALWAMFTGIMQIVAYIKLHSIFENDLLLCFSGLISIIISIVLFRFPIESIVMIAWILGVYSFVFGLLSILSTVRRQKEKD